MPKERINNPPLVMNPATDAPPVAWVPTEGSTSPGSWIETVGDGESQRDPVLTVGWSRDAYVQVSVEMDVEYAKMIAASPDVSDNRTGAYTPPLTRAEINTLIATLRKARDQVFGRDA